MAVAQGYGKTITSGSVFAYDTGDTRNSFKGKPTTNLLTQISKVGTNDSTYFKTNSGTEVKPVPNVGVKTVHYVNIFNDYYGGSGNCCPAPMNFGSFAISPSTEYTYQIIYKTATGYAHQNYMYHYEYNGGTYVTEYGLWSSSREIDLGDGWKHAWGTFTSNASANTFYTYLFHYEYGVWNKIEVAGIMLTQGSNIIPPTQFLDVSTTRSSTQGLLPLVGNSTINLSNVSFDSNAQMVFDGTNDYVNLGASSNWAFGGNGTVELMVKPTDSTGNNRLWCVDNNSTSLDAFLDGTSYKIFLHGGVVGTLTPLTQNAWNHVVVTYTGGTVQIYINGTPATMDGTTTGYSMSNSGTLYLGCYTDLAYNLYGEIPVFKTYNRALTTSEIKQNFRHYRTRFGMEYDTFYFAVSNRITKYNRRWINQEPIYDEEDNIIGYNILGEGEVSGENIASITPAYTIYRKPDTSFQNPGEYTEVTSDNIGTPARLTEYGVQTKYSSGKWLTTVTVRKNNATGELNFEFPDGGTVTYGEEFYKTIVTPYVP